MQFTPSQAAVHLKESIASYIESQYRISHTLVFAEQSALLRDPNGLETLIVERSAAILGEA